MPKLTQTPVSGQRFTRWTVIEEVLPRPALRRVLCRCDCGTIRTVYLFQGLLGGQSKSCGCLALERRTARNTTHGLSDTAEHNIWKGMKARCYNPKDTGYKKYGARGITVCERWINSFENFLADMGPRPSPEHSIERADGNGPYAPDNCRWATRAEQQRNLRSNVWLTLGERTMILTDWAREYGIHYVTLKNRLNRGWPVEQAITAPVKKRSPP